MKLVVKPGTGRGRPRQVGERDAAGRLKRPGPNPKVVAERRALVGEGGDISRAAHPLDLALAREWISEAQHRAGTAYARLSKASRMGAPDRDAGAGVQEMPGAETRDTRPVREMADLEIVAAFDAVFDRMDDSDDEARSAAAFREWKAMNAVMTPGEQREVFLVCVRASWPQWIVQRAAGRLGTRWETAYMALTRGLSAITARARARRDSEMAAAGPCEGRTPGAETRRPAPGRREVTRYVDGDGHLLFELERRAQG